MEYEGSKGACSAAAVIYNNAMHDLHGRFLNLFGRLQQNDDHLLDLHGLTVAEAQVLIKEGVNQWWSRSITQSGNPILIFHSARTVVVNKSISTTSYTTSEDCHWCGKALGRWSI